MSAVPAVWVSGTAEEPASGSAAAAAPSSGARPVMCGPPGQAPGSPGGGAGGGLVPAGSGAVAGVAVASLGLACAVGSSAEPGVWPSPPQGGAEAGAGAGGRASPRPPARLSAAVPAAAATTSAGATDVSREGSSASRVVGEEVLAARAPAPASGATPLGGGARSLSLPASSGGMGAQGAAAADPAGGTSAVSGTWPALWPGATTHQSSCDPPGAAGGSSSADAVT